MVSAASTNDRKDETGEPMILSHLLDAYLAEREASPRYQESLRRTVKRAAAYGLDTTTAITPEKVNRFLASVPVSAVTKNNLRREFLTIWKWGYEAHRIDVPPGRVMKIRATPKPPRAWNQQTLDALLTAAESDHTAISQRLPGIERCHVLPAWIVIAYDTGLRLGDILSLRRENVANGCVVCNAQKTGKMTVRRLSPYALDRSASLLSRSPDGSLFSWCLPRRRALAMWRSFLKERGVSGTAKWLRRSGATYVEIDKPGEASKFLGHSTQNPGLAARFYIDASLSLQIPNSPPPLR